MTKLEIYGIAALVLVLCLVGAFFKGRADGMEAATEKGAAAVLAANAKTDQVNQQLLIASQENARVIAQRDDQHEKDLDAARAHLKPVIVRIPADQGQLPAAATGTGAAAAAAGGSAQLSVSAERDIGPALLVLARACQRDRDQVTGWREYDAQLRSFLSQ